MKRLIYFLLLFLFIACDKETNIPIPPSIKITVADDVIPTQVHFEVDDIWDGYYWRYNQIHGSGNIPVHYDTYCFSEGSTANVQLTVYKDTYTITVDSTFILPTKECDKLKIYGITFTKEAKKQIETQENLRVDFTINDDSKKIITTTFKREINDSKLEYIFDTPVFYSVGQYWGNPNSVSVRVYLDIFADDNIKLYANEFSLTDRGQILDNDLFDGGLQTLTMINHNCAVAYLNIDLIPQE